MRLIDADTLKERIEKYQAVHLSHRRLSAIRREAEEVINDIRFAIDVAPTIDPVKRGRWKVTPLFIKCLECGQSFMLIPQNYCPNCGAKMDGEEE